MLFCTLLDNKKKYFFMCHKIKFYWDFPFYMDMQFGLYLREVDPAKANEWVHTHIKDRDEHENKQSIQHLNIRKEINNTWCISQSSITIMIRKS